MMEPRLTPVPPAGSVLATVPAGISELVTPASAKPNPADSRVDFASAIVFPRRSGTGTGTALMTLLDAAANSSPPYFALAADMTAGHIRWRAVAADPLSNDSSRWSAFLSSASSLTVTTPTTVATLVLAPLIQVSLLSSVVPVLPIMGTCGDVRLFEEEPVGPVITRCMA